MATGTGYRTAAPPGTSRIREPVGTLPVPPALPGDDAKRRSRMRGAGFEPANPFGTRS